jgi:hypothetical protein
MFKIPVGPVAMFQLERSGVSDAIEASKVTVLNISGTVLVEYPGNSEWQFVFI